MPTIKAVTGKVIRFRNARDWEQFHNPKDVAISLTLEAAELLEHFQWKSPKEVEKHIRDNKTAISEELADVLYWVLLFLIHTKKLWLIFSRGDDFLMGGRIMGCNVGVVGFDWEGVLDSRPPAPVLLGNLST